MNRSKFCFKFIGVALLTVMMFSVDFVLAGNKADDKQNEIVVAGLVRDAHTKLPIAAAQITVPGKNISAVTDDKGQFSIKLKSANDIIHVSAYDYNKREIAIVGRQNIVVDLYSDMFTGYFNQVVSVNGKTENSSLISSSKTIADVSKSTVQAADELLQSRLGGDVRAITRSGLSGGGASLFIRGINSINANAQPLFVIDGVVWNSMYDAVSIHNGYFANPLDNIDMNDIEDITVIKDGATIYGSKGANGVILINTKRAKSMVTKISVNVQTGMVTTPGSIPMMNGEQFRIYASEMLDSKGLIRNDVSGYGFLETDPTNAQIYNANHNVTDWANEVYQQGLSNSYTINATGGDEKAMYYFSLGYAANSGIVKTTDFERIHSRFNADFKLIDKLTMGMNIGFNRNQRTLQDDGMSSFSSPTWVSRIKSPFLNPYGFTSLGQQAQDYELADEFGTTNPSGLIESAINNLQKYRFNIGVLPAYKINSEFTLSTQFDYNLDKTVEGKFTPMGYTAVRHIDNYGDSYNQVSSQVMRNTAIYDDTRLTYEKKLDSKNYLKAIYGIRYIYNKYESDYIEEHNTGSNNNTTITGDYKYLQVRGINNETKSLSNYLNADYNYDNKYFFSGTVSMDGSSRFGRQTESGIHLFNRSWAIFPAVSGAWIVSGEEFMKNVSPVSFFKIRAGYGLTGNDGIADYEAMAYFSSVGFMSKANGLVLNNIENTAVQWETTGKANVGFDLGLFNDRLNVGLDLFSSKTSNLLVLRTLPIITGLASYWDNGGEMTNKGFELSLNWKTLNLKNLKWELGLNVGHYKNEITALPESDYTTQVYGGEVITAVGEAAGSFYGFKTAGVFATEAEATAADLKILNPDGSYTNFEAGDMIFVDQVADGVIDDKDKQVIGNPNPDLYGTITSKWSYKRFSLSTVFTYSYGNDVYNYYRSQLEAGKDFSNQTSLMATRWTAEGQVTNQPKAVYGDPMGNARFSDRWIEDGSYIRFKTVTLSYDLPVKSKYIEGVNLWVSANNLFTATNYLGLDPEFSAGNSVYYQGVDAGLIPQTKSYYIGVKLDL